MGGGGRDERLLFSKLGPVRGSAGLRVCQGMLGAIGGLPTSILLLICLLNLWRMASFKINHNKL